MNECKCEPIKLYLLKTDNQLALSLCPGICPYSTHLSLALSNAEESLSSQLLYLSTALLVNGILHFSVAHTTHPVFAWVVIFGS